MTTLHSRALVTLLFCSIFQTLIYGQDTLFKAPERGFTSWLPAPDWEHALLSGNGTMGALVFGHPHEETIILSHAALYLPQERSEQLINQAARLEEIRKLILEGEYEKAAAIPVELRKEYGYTDERDPFIPAFDVKIIQEPANITKYVRSVNFSTGEASTIWKDDTGTFQRKLFVSRADSVIVLSMTGDNRINCKINFQHRPVQWNQWQYVGEHVGEMTSAAEDVWLTYRSSFKMKHEGGIEGYEGVGRVVVQEGTVEADGNQLTIKDAREVLILIKIEPNYNYVHSAISEIKKQLSSVSKDYGQLLENHINVHGEIFNRVKLSLGGTGKDHNLHAEEILLKAREQEVPLALIEKVFDAGRYNILSSIGTHPPNLQGIWSGTWTAPWSAGFTHDGNLPAAMAVVMPGNMPELMQAYVRYHHSLLADYRHNARMLFGTRGINLPAHTTTSGWPTDFNQTWCLSLWTGGAGWAADIIYDYYRYTGDKEYLKNDAYTFMKETAWFYEDFLTTGADGKFVFNPSYSPENNPSNSVSQATLNATMDVMIAKQLLRNCIEAGEIIGEEKLQLNKWKEMLVKMPEYTVNDEGVLKEWLWPDLKDNYSHRHVSQLYSLFAAADEDILEDPVLKKGAEKLIEKKLEFRRKEDGGEMAFGLVQLGLSAAHLRNAEQAREAVNWLAAKYWSAGFGSFHNVGGLLNTDISGGLPAVIIEMLVYSENGRVDLLPALPDEWPKGSLDGTLLRNQIELKSLIWNRNDVKAVFFSEIDQKVKITLPGDIHTITVSNKNSILGDRNELREVIIDLPAKQELTIDISLK